MAVSDDSFQFVAYEALEHDVTHTELTERYNWLEDHDG